MQRDEIWRVATLNIWNRQGPWTQRLPMLREWIRTIDADVIGLQEVLGMPGLPSQAAELVDGLGWHVYDAPAWHVGGGLTFGNAIVSRHALADTRTLPLPSPPGLDTRTAAFARVDAPHGPMPVFVTHLTFQQHLASARVQQVKALVAHVHELCPIDGPPPVLLGDFNADPDSDEMRFLRGVGVLDGASVYFADCWQATRGALDAGYTYDRQNAFALRSHEPSRRIDYCYVRPGSHLRGEPIASELALVEPRDGVWASDHYGVVADIIAAKRSHDPW